MEQADRNFYCERLDAMWGRYVAFVNFLVTIAGGTVVVLIANLVKLRLETEKLESVPWLFWLAMIAAIVSSIYAIFWRALAQRFMEYEVLAPLASIEDYAGAKRAQACVTNPRRFEGRDHKFMRSAYKMASWIVGGGLLLSWALIGIQLYQEL